MTGPRALRTLLGTVALAGTGLLAGTVARSLVGAVEFTDRVEVAAVAAAAGARGMAIGLETGVPALHIFGDYECPACAAFERVAGDTLRSLARHGHLRFVYHHAPLSGHRRGPTAAAVAYCAAEAGVGWEVHRALYENAPEWGTGPEGRAGLVATAGNAVRDTAALRACMDDEATFAKVAADRSAADVLGLAAVPAVFLEDRRIRVQSWRALVRFVTTRVSTP